MDKRNDIMNRTSHIEGSEETYNASVGGYWLSQACYDLSNELYDA